MYLSIPPYLPSIYHDVYSMFLDKPLRIQAVRAQLRCQKSERLHEEKGTSWITQECGVSWCFVCFVRKKTVKSHVWCAFFGKRMYSLMIGNSRAAIACDSCITCDSEFTPKAIGPWVGALSTRAWAKTRCAKWHAESCRAGSWVRRLPGRLIAIWQSAGPHSLRTKSCQRGGELDLLPPFKA